MRFPTPLQERWILWVAALFCVTMDLYLCFKHFRERREPMGELVSRMIGSNFFLMYFAHRFAVRLHYAVGPASNGWAWLDWGLNVSPFLLFGLSYVIRVPACSSAWRLREWLFPFFCILLPVGVYESDSLQTMILNAKLSFFSGFTRRFPIDPFGSWKVVSESLIVLGSILILWGLISLRKSFSIMAEAREFIRHGPYRWIRHPVYLGESLATLGWFILKPSAL